MQHVHKLKLYNLLQVQYKYGILQTLVFKNNRIKAM